MAYLHYLLFGDSTALDTEGKFPKQNRVGEKKKTMIGCMVYERMKGKICDKTANAKREAVRGERMRVIG